MKKRILHKLQRTIPSAPKYLFAVLLFGLLTLSRISVQAQGMSMDVTGNLKFKNGDFIIEHAGEDFQQSILSNSNLFITVRSDNFWDSGNNPAPRWRIEVNKSDINWTDEVELQLKRAGNGKVLGKKYSAATSVEGGTSFQTIGNVPALFLSGAGQLGFIPVQAQVSGISVLHGSRDFETNIVFTIYDAQ